MSRLTSKELPHNEPGVGRIVEYDFPHARLTLKQRLPNGELQDPAVEIEVWPKSGQSAYCTLHAEHIRAIAEQMIEMCDQLEQLEHDENIIQLPVNRRKGEPRPS